MELRNAIFNVVEYLTQYQLSDQAKKLIIHYFNESKESGAYERALAAVARYYSDDIPAEEEIPERFRKMLAVLKREADEWDIEQKNFPA
jgi:hypothetical protein